MADSNLAPKGRHAHGRRRTALAARPLRGERGGAASAPLELDRLIHERMRLAIVSSLAVNEA